MIYLDNNAMASLEPGLLDFLQQLFSQGIYANPSSVHSAGKKSRKLIHDTTGLIQRVLSFPGKIIYTSSATESLNLAIASLPKGSHVITCSSEHPAIIEPLKHADLSVSYLDPEQGSCVVSPQQIEAAIRPTTSAIVLGWVNSEIGAKIHIEAIAQIANERHLQFIVDATAIIGRERVSIPQGVTMVAFSGHKFHALSGIGALLISAGVKVAPLIWGGGQQGGVRSGTENLWGIASLFYIFTMLEKQQEEIAERIAHYRNNFEKRLKEHIPEMHIHCEHQPRVNNISAIAFPPLEGEVMQIALDIEGIACGYGSACSSGATTAFKSLVAMNMEQDVATATLRFSFSHLLAQEDLDLAIEKIVKVVTRLKDAW
ncbi:cysteine desulfurase family protein [Chlamydia abortus]|uniref:cysteine desulfurase family protein n=1 Tax=Chlamydia abortus TaxID=83555 RepID=UPI000A27F06D|nr:cysteine desulfurase family protein [Chlamydia abortus]SGA07921.1 cysteine desulfurase [Chlamydia abortus]SGW20065.1 cysteine desulfurase [Chlamydia abortus]